MAGNPLVGTWRLISFERTGPDGQVSYPYGQGAIGYFMYGEDGYVAVTFMRANRQRFAASAFGGGSTEEKAAAAESYFSYCGTYQVEGNTVVHRPEVSLFPNSVGSDLVRTFERDGDKLSVFPSSSAGGSRPTTRLILERV